MNHMDFWSLPEGELLLGFDHDVKFDRKLRVQLMGSHICYGGKGGGSKAPAPDPNIGKAAMEQAKLGQQWLEFAQEQFSVGNERQADIDAMTKEVTGTQLEGMRSANERADQQWQRYLDVFQPAQDEFIDEAKNWASPERQAELAAEARADVMAGAQGAKQQTQRQMAGMGINPTSGRYAGIDRGNNLNTALASAGAQNNARSQVRSQGLALKEGIANMGQGATSTSAQQVGLGLNSGNSATGNMGAANAQWQGNNAIMGQGFAGAMQGQAGQASTLNNLYGNQLSAWQTQQQASSANAAGLMGGIGNVAGMAMSYFSSEELKEDKRPVEGALEAVDQMPVEQWKYKDGVEDGGEHIGPYAEDFHQATGKGDGKSIPVQDAIGVTMKAVQELNRKVDKLAGKKSMMAGGMV